MKPKPQQRDGAGFVDAGRLYTLRRFLRDVGLGENTKRRAERAGRPLATLQVGRMVYVRGVDGIAWLEQLARDRTSDAVSSSENSGENMESTNFVAESVATGGAK